MDLEDYFTYLGINLFLDMFGFHLKFRGFKKKWVRLEMMYTSNYRHLFLKK